MSLPSRLTFVAALPCYFLTVLLVAAQSLPPAYLTELWCHQLAGGVLASDLCAFVSSLCLNGTEFGAEQLCPLLDSSIKVSVFVPSCQWASSEQRRAD